MPYDKKSQDAETAIERIVDSWKMRRKDDDDRKSYDEVFNKQNLMRIYKLMSDGVMDKFDFTISVDEEALPFMMLKLTLQPLVENAIYHGIKERRGPGSIEVAAARRDGMLVFRVTDNGVGMSEEKLAAVRASLQAPAAGSGRNGYGLSNVHERIQLSFGPGYGLRFESSPGAGTTVELLHPLITPEGE